MGIGTSTVSILPILPDSAAVSIVPAVPRFVGKGIPVRSCLSNDALQTTLLPAITSLGRVRRTETDHMIDVRDTAPQVFSSTELQPRHCSVFAVAPTK